MKCTERIGCEASPSSRHVRPPSLVPNRLRTPTAHPLVFIYSLPECRGRWQAETTAADGLAVNTPVRECDSRFSNNVYVGGLRANARAPLADLLSTFTAAWTLDQLQALARIETAAALRYAEALALPDGGFRGGLWDGGTDVEYTFYGLGVVALLS